MDTTKWGAFDSIVIDKFKGSFTANFPAEISLDGELWGGRGTFDKIGALVRKKETTDDDWKGVVFKGKFSSGLCSKTSTVFDSPSLKDKLFEERMKLIDNCLKSCNTSFAEIVQHERCNGMFGNIFLVAC